MIHSYPDATDLKEVLDSSVPAANARSFFRARGVVVSTPNRGFISSFGSVFFLSQQAVSQLSEFTERESNSQRSSRIYLEGVQDLAEIAEALQNLQSSFVDPKAKLQVANVVEVKGTITAQIKYDKVKHGRVELLKRQQKEATLAVKPVPGRPGTVAIDFVANEEQDHKHVRAVFGALGEAPGSTVPNVCDISLIRLTPENRIKLFDEFFSSRFTEWTREEIKGLKVKKPEPDDAGDVGEEDIGETELSGINSAVLQGTGLRTNRVVKRFLDSKYYFAGATLRLKHRRDLLSMDLEISFRGKSEVVEMRLTNFREEVTIEGTESGGEQRINLSQEEQWRHSQHFQDVLFQIYQNLLDSQEKAA